MHTFSRELWCRFQFGRLLPHEVAVGEAGFYHGDDVVVGEADAPTHEAGTVEKCTFCHNLIDRGEVPACMQLCLAGARFWGDLDDPESDVSKAIEGRTYRKLREGEGTAPNVFYLE